MVAPLRSILYPASRFPADPRAVFILALSVFSGMTALLLEAAPESLESLLPRWGVVTWGILLTLGSAVTLLGMAFQNLNGVILEQIGSVAVGATTIFYATLAIWVVGPNAISGVSIIFAWGLSCFVRWWQLQMLIDAQYRRQLRKKIQEQLEP